METEPDLRVDGLSIWIARRQFPDDNDWDGNSLMVRARMEAPGAAVQCEGALLTSVDVERFRNELVAAGRTLSGEATLGGFEPELTVRLKVNRLGHVAGEVDITPEYMSQSHCFRLDLDQTYLPPIIDACDAILERFPAIRSD